MKANNKSHFFDQRTGLTIGLPLCFS